MINNDITLQGNTATWVMPRIDGTMGGTYTGTFTFRCFLDPLRQLQAGREYRELLGSLAIQADETEADLAFALVQLKHRILTAPPFWSSTLQESGMAGNIGDLNVISAVIEAAMLAQALYKTQVQNERDAILDRGIKIGEELLAKKAAKEP